jgi:nucleotide-binding universal stress UspA family protein
MQHILVPLDGSTTAAVALPHASALARTFGHALRLMRVVPLYERSQSLFWQMTMPGALRETWERAALDDARAALAHDVAALAGAGIAAVDGQVVAADDVAGQIIAAAGDGATAMLVMASHGMTGPGRWLLGSVAARVVAAAPVPLMLVRPDAAVPHYRRLAVALDGSPFAEQALDHAVALAQATGAGLQLVSVAVSAAALAAVDAYQAGIATRLAPTGITVHATSAVGDAAEQILLATAQADVLVLATHGATGLRGHLLGSVASRLAEHARQPLLLVRVQPDA